MKKKIGFIGCGNMGKSIVLGLLNSNIVDNSDLLVSDRSQEYLDKLNEELGIAGTVDNKEVAKFAEVLFLAVKPNVYKSVIEEIRDLINEDTIVVTIAAGVEIAQAEEWFNKKVKIVRSMPNTPALVSEGMSAICNNKFVNREEIEYVKTLFNSFGECEELEEKYFHGFIALCGSSPAYVFVFIEAMADAAVKLGIPRAKAYKMASQSVLGSAKMVLETGKHPGELKDMVCSPAGTTIEAVMSLEETGFRNSVIKSMEVCAEKSIEMSK